MLTTKFQTRFAGKKQKKCLEDELRKGMKDFAIRVLEGNVTSAQETAILPDVLEILMFLPEK